LILASIVEKETALAVERPRIAGVFSRRLERNMRLQTDPTVIYGLGLEFDGNLTRLHLRTDTPYNTYTRRGLRGYGTVFRGHRAGRWQPQVLGYEGGARRGSTGVPPAQAGTAQ
jgi:hypothetical protein